MAPGLLTVWDFNPVGVGGKGKEKEQRYERTAGVVFAGSRYLG